MVKSNNPGRERIVTIANALSLFRVFLTVPLIWALEQDDMRLVLILTGAAVLSDYFDGFLARRAHAITDLGKLLDPIADKFIMLGVLVFLIMDEERKFPLIFFLILSVRDITIVNIGAYLMQRRQEVFESNIVGKWFVGVSTFALILYIVKWTTPGFWVLMFSIFLMLVSWAMYLRRYLRYFKTLPPL